jgi:hypothetical protein
MTKYDGRYCNETCVPNCHHERIWIIDYDTYTNFMNLPEGSE